MVNYKSLFFTILLHSVIVVFAQKPSSKSNLLLTEKSPLEYKNKVYLSTIKSVQIFPEDQEGSLPIITLGTSEKIKVSFDDLRADIRSLYYSLEHCNADGSPSNLPAMDYAGGFNEARIEEIKLSQNTRIPYTHYSFTFPNEYVKPKLGGNYLLKVYESGDKSRLILTSKIFVVKPLSHLEIAVLPSSRIDSKREYQKLNITLKTAIEISNPQTQFQLHVLQNQREDSKQILRLPTKVEAHKLIFDAPTTLEFKANNEFRTADIRSIRNASSSIKEIIRGDTTKVILFADKDLKTNNYIYIPDDNGRYFIRNLDYESAETQSEYVLVRFALAADKKKEENIYIIGGFNNFEKDSTNKLTYDERNTLWTTTLLLKQGLYNYEYNAIKNNELITDLFSGSHFETENEYIAIAYYRKPGTYWDEIIGIGHQHINTNKGERE